MKKHFIGVPLLFAATIGGLVVGHFGIPMLRGILAPADLAFFVTTPGGAFRVSALFALGAVGCFMLIAAGGYYCRFSSVPTRLAFVLLPMLVGAVFGAVQVSKVFRMAINMAETLGTSPSIAFDQAHFHLVPLLGLMGGILGLSIGYLLRKRKGQQTGGVNECSAGAPHS